jgi:hypothetical protein
MKVFKIEYFKSVRVVDLTVKTFQNNFFKPNTRTGYRMLHDGKTRPHENVPSQIITN